MPYACFTTTTTNDETWWEINETGGCGATFFCDDVEFGGEETAAVTSILRKGHPDLVDSGLERTDHEDLPDRLLARVAKYRLTGEW